ncbi:phosphoglycerate kinase [Candidatus Uhrbacteria bacterium]|nr:phosphoglycerate kinase [Candidatus Uhrbacteria bacterium]
MKLNLRTFSPKQKIKGAPILVRVDWNVPDAAVHGLEGSLKLERSVSFIKQLSKRGAVVILLTHFGRPKRKDKVHSTHFLAKRMKRYGLSIAFHPESVSRPDDRKRLAERLLKAKPGSIHLLENVRFEKGEEKNAISLSKAWSSLGDIFINDAFASCHRAHSSVVGIAKLIPSYAGPSLTEEVAHLGRLLEKPSSPFVAVIGGKKLSTKIPVVKELLARCDQVLVGGAMATPFLVAKKLQVGKSYLEKDSVADAGKLLKKTGLVLPIDVMVADKLVVNPKLKRVMVDAIGKKDIIVDIGPSTLAAWSKILGSSKTILWNGPVGWTECRPCGNGSRFLARIIATRAKGPAFGVSGGGDTLPILAETKTAKWFDFISTGGGAMLEFLSLKGKLPGLLALMK